MLRDLCIATIWDVDSTTERVWTVHHYLETFVRTNPVTLSTNKVALFVITSALTCLSYCPFLTDIGEYPRAGRVRHEMPNLDV